MNSTDLLSNFTDFEKFLEDRKKFNERLNSKEFVNDQRRLVEDLLDHSAYERNVHPRVSLLPD